MAENPQRPIPPDQEEGEWIVRGGQAYPAGPGQAFPGASGGRQTVGSLVGQPQGEQADQLDLAADLDYSNPFRQNIERVWFDGKIVYAVELGELDVDPESVKVAQEYQIVYRVELDERGKPVDEPARVPGQYNIYDSVPGMDKYSPLWLFTYVIVPPDYQPNTLRSEADCLNSGYQIVRSTVIEN